MLKVCLDTCGLQREMKRVMYLQTYIVLVSCYPVVTVNYDYCVVVKTEEKTHTRKTILDNTNLTFGVGQ